MDLCEAECSACLLYHYTSLLSADATRNNTGYSHDYSPHANERYTFPDQAAVNERTDRTPKHLSRKSSLRQHQPLSDDAARQIVESFWESFETSAVHWKKATNRRQERHHRRERPATAESNHATETLGRAHLPGTKGADFFTERAKVHRTGAPPVCDQSQPAASYEQIDNNSDNGSDLRHQLREFDSGRLSKRKRKPKRTKPSVKKVKGYKKHKILKRKGVQLFGPEVEEKNSDITPSLLLQQLDTEVAGLKRDGVTLSKQMWLLFSSFEEFLRSRYPETAAGIKRYAKINPGNAIRDVQCPNTLVEHNNNNNKDDDQSEYNWIEESCHLYSNVAEVTDWLRPAEECDDWSDDSDRVRKLTKTDECVPERRKIVTDEKCNNGADNMNILWYTKLKKIDKSGARRFRNRTPERKHWQSPDTFGESNTSALEIDTPIRRPEDLFDQSTPHFEEKTITERLSRRDCGRKVEAEKRHLENHEDELTLPAGPVSPVTISSGYDSDRDGLREADVDGILYGLLPGYKKGAVSRDTNKSPLYVPMSDTSTEKIYENLNNCRKRPDNSERTSRSVQDLSVGNSEVTSTVDSTNTGMSRSMDDLLTDSEMRKGVRSLPLNSSAAVWKGEDKSINSGMDEEDKENACIYENLPAALYAQVSPPKPQVVYKTPTCLKADPMWESTPLDDVHKPKIINVSGASDTGGSQHEGSLQSQIRKRIRLLLEDRSGAQTPYKSAFRPYNKALTKVVTAENQNKQQDQSIAELRRVNVMLNNSHYLYMSPSRSDISQNSPSLHSVMAGDFTIHSANVDQSRFDTFQSTTATEKSPDSGHGSTGTSDLGSPPMQKNAFVNLKDSRIVHKDNLCKSTDMFDSESEFNNTYETIPADIETFWKDLPDKSLTSNVTSASEHTYCKIGDIPTILEPTCHFKVPEPPPHFGRSSLRKANDARADIQTAVREVQDNASRGKQMRTTDIVQDNRYHKYTVSEVLRSFRQYAGHLTAAGDANTTGSGSPQEHVIPAPEEFSQRRRSQSGTLPVGECIPESKSGANAQSRCPEQEGRTRAAFTPGFSDFWQPSRIPGPQYSAGGGVKLAAIKKTLSFRDFTSPGGADSLSHSRQRSEPASEAARSGRKSRHPRSFCAGVTADFTPTVIDGLQSYQTTPSDVTTELIISPPSAFRSSSSPEEHLYENIRDMEFMRERRRKALEEGRAYRATPLQRTQSALHVHKIDFDDAREIFC